MQKKTNYPNRSTEDERKKRMKIKYWKEKKRKRSRECKAMTKGRLLKKLEYITGRNRKKKRKIEGKEPRRKKQKKEGEKEKKWEKNGRKVRNRRIRVTGTRREKAE